MPTHSCFNAISHPWFKIEERIIFQEVSGLEYASSDIKNCTVVCVHAEPFWVAEAEVKMLNNVFVTVKHNRGTTIEPQISD